MHSPRGEVSLYRGEVNSPIDQLPLYRKFVIVETYIPCQVYKFDGEGLGRVHKDSNGRLYGEWWVIEMYSAASYWEVTFLDLISQKSWPLYRKSRIGDNKKYNRRHILPYLVIGCWRNGGHENRGLTATALQHPETLHVYYEGVHLRVFVAYLD